MKDLTKLNKWRDFKDEKKHFPNGCDHSKIGFFEMRLKTGRKAYITAVIYDGWEHVSVATLDTCPTWEEMCQVKEYFWDPEEVVVQFHPRKSEYVNVATTCLHLWKKINEDFETPPAKLVL